MQALIEMIIGFIAMLAAAACAWGAAAFFGAPAGLMAGAMLGSILLLSTEAFIAKTDAVLCGTVVLMMAALARIYGAARGGPQVYVETAAATAASAPTGTHSNTQSASATAACSVSATSPRPRPAARWRTSSPPDPEKKTPPPNRRGRCGNAWCDAPPVVLV